MMLAALAAAALAIVAQDQTSLRASPGATSTVMTTLPQGDVVEIRGERAEYLKVYDHRLERGGFVRRESVRPIGFSDADAPELLAVLRFLRDSRGSEALGISYGAAFLKAMPPRALTAEPLDAIGQMAERLAATNDGSRFAVVEQFGIHMRSFERNGRMQVCYDGEMFRHVLVTPRATPEQRARAALALTRPDCIDPNIGPTLRVALDDQRAALLDQVDERELSGVVKSRLHARRAGVWAAVAYERARRGEDPSPSAQRALSELASINANELGEDRRLEYTDAAVRVSAIRWAAVTPTRPVGPLALSATPGEPGQTCIALDDTRRPRGVAPLVRRCTYGIVWLASIQMLAQNAGVALAVQPLEGWRELWVFHFASGHWTIDVLAPGADDPELGYVDYAGFVPATSRLLIAREVKAGTRFRKRFEEIRLDDLALVREASTPELLRNFGRYQDVAWRRDSLALR